MAGAAVLGLGNVLMGDDAVGPWVIERLRARWHLPEEVEIEDLGTPGLDLHPHLAGRGDVILVDAVRATGAPGEVRQYSLGEILAHAPGPRVSPHDPGLKETLASLRFAGLLPASLRLVGVIPDRVENQVGLSPACADALPVAELAVIDELIRQGFAPTRRFTTAPFVPWWEQGPAPAGCRT